MVPRRRRLLATAAMLALSGCSGLAHLPDGSGTRIASIRVQNVHAEPHAVHVFVVKDGDPVLWETRRLDAAYQENATWHATGADLPNVPTEPGEYVMYVRVDDDDETHVLDLSTGEHGACVRLEPEIDRDGSFAVEYSAACVGTERPQTS